jgi:ribonuclease VapC
MVIDTSALIAILCDEPEAPSIEATIEADPVRLLSAASYLETSIVIESRFGEPGGRELDLLIREAGIEVVAVSPEQSEIARAAYRQFGRGRHPAGLNFGDCFSYALSVATGEPLLFKGDDFAKSDARTVKLVSAVGR